MESRRAPENYGWWLRFAFTEVRPPYEKPGLSQAGFLRLLLE